jgi:transcriptional regulator with XRE-family HTH domain
MPQNPDPVYVALGTRMRDLRKAAHITQETVAIETGLSRQSVANIEKGRQRFMVHTLLDIARALGVTPTVLLPQASERQVTFNVDLYPNATPKEKRVVLSFLESEPKPPRS